MPPLDATVDLLGMLLEDLEFLQLQTPIRLAEIYAELNTWKWPANSTEPEPVNHWGDSKIPRRIGMMEWIKGHTTIEMRLAAIRRYALQGQKW